MRGKDLTFVRLFSEPDETFTPKHVVIKPESKIDYVEAKVPIFWSEDPRNISFGVSNSGKVWLHSKSTARTAGFPAKRISRPSACRKPGNPRLPFPYR